MKQEIGSAGACNDVPEGISLPKTGSWANWIRGRCPLSAPGASMAFMKTCAFSLRLPSSPPRLPSTFLYILALLTALLPGSAAFAQAAKAAHTAPNPPAKPAAEPVASVYPAHEGFVDANGVMIYY